MENSQIASYTNEDDFPGSSEHSVSSLKMTSKINEGSHLTRLEEMEQHVQQL